MQQRNYSNYEEQIIIDTYDLKTLRQKDRFSSSKHYFKAKKYIENTE